MLLVLVTLVKSSLVSKLVLQDGEVMTEFIHEVIHLIVHEVINNDKHQDKQQPLTLAQLLVNLVKKILWLDDAKVNLVVKRDRGSPSQYNCAGERGIQLTKRSPPMPALARFAVIFFALLYCQGRAGAA